MMKSVKTAMEDAVIHFKRGTQVADSTGLKVDGNAKISSLEVKMDNSTSIWVCLRV